MGTILSPFNKIYHIRLFRRDNSTINSFPDLFFLLTDDSYWVSSFKVRLHWSSRLRTFSSLEPYSSYTNHVSLVFLISPIIVPVLYTLSFSYTPGPVSHFPNGNGLLLSKSTSIHLNHHPFPCSRESDEDKELLYVPLVGFHSSPHLYDPQRFTILREGPFCSFSWCFW